MSEAGERCPLCFGRSEGRKEGRKKRRKKIKFGGKARMGRHEGCKEEEEEEE